MYLNVPSRARLHREPRRLLMSYIVLLGRILFSASFLAAVPMSGILALAGGLSVLIGYQTRVGAWLLVAFLIAITGVSARRSPTTAPAARTGDRSASRRGRPGPRSRAKLRGGRTLARITCSRARAPTCSSGSDATSRRAAGSSAPPRAPALTPAGARRRWGIPTGVAGGNRHSGVDLHPELLFESD